MSSTFANIIEDIMKAIFFTLAIAFFIAISLRLVVASTSEPYEQDAEEPTTSLNEWPQWRFMNSKKAEEYLLYLSFVAGQSLSRLYTESYSIDMITKKVTMDMHAIRLGLGKNPKVKVLLLCGQHAKEIITTSVCFEMLRELIENPKWNNLLKSGVLSVIAVPLANPKGRDRAIEIDPCHRTNYRFVDLNRNFPLVNNSVPHPINNFQNLGVSYQSILKEIYEGPFPFSESENKFINTLLEGETGDFFSWGCPDVSINVHAGGRYVMRPYGSKYESPRYNALMSLISEIILLKHCQDCFEGNSIRTLYESPGNSMDYIEDRCNPIINFIWEVFVDEEAADARDCFGFFNPTTYDGFQEVMKTWKGAMETTLDHALKINTIGMKEYLDLYFR